MKNKTILFGGTFDPIHLGHTSVAKFASDIINAENLIFIPAKLSPLKKNSPVASDKDRIEMIRLAIKSNDRFELSDFEINNRVPSYTINTVKHFKNILGDQTELYWLIGADAIEDLPNWYKIDELLSQCNISIMLRGGYKAPNLSKLTEIWGQELTQKLKSNMISTPLIDVSSTVIRNKLAKSEDVSEMLDQEVLQYIKENNLYVAKND